MVGRCNRVAVEGLSGLEVHESLIEVGTNELRALFVTFTTTLINLPEGGASAYMHRLMRSRTAAAASLASLPKCVALERAQLPRF
jgi:hypothetical protein